jgi:hypothetical protein
MKKPLLIVIIILVVLLAIPAVCMIRWAFQVKKPMDIVILDKTVPTLARVNHKSFTWILNNQRFVKKEKKNPYSVKNDYYGFSPTRPLREKLYSRNEYRLTDLIDIAESNDALYYTDTYGVYFNDWYAGINKSRRSRKIYGGLNNNDYLLLYEMKRRDKLIILEYNTFDYPTAQLEAFKTKDLLGIESSGWTGKYFSSLDSTSSDEFPLWLTSMYRKEYKKPWTFTKPGIVLIGDKNIIVLEEGKHLENAIPLLTTDPEFCEKYGMTNSVAFDKWFDIIDPKENNVISKFSLQTTSLGDSLLSNSLLDNEFPAVVQEPGKKLTYYFSGDFASSNIPYCTYRFKGINKLKVLLYSDKLSDPRRFFWLYYKPLVSGIFTEYYDNLKVK